MSQIPPDLKYTQDHEWLKADGLTITLGITDYAQAQLGDVVMVELPKVGTALRAGQVFGSVESPKSVSDLMTPIAGTVVAVNQALDDAPEAINTSPYDSGWVCQIAVTDLEAFSALLDAAGYTAFLSGLDH